MRRAGWEVRAYDRDPTCLQYARERKIIDGGYDSVAPAVAGAQLVCLAVPPADVLALGREAAPHLVPGCIVTDVASVKENIVAGMMELLPASAYYVGGHPMAGSEQGGIRAASPYLLVGAPYLLTPVPATCPQALDFMVELVKNLRAKPLVMSPAEHDYWVAGVSHLPYLVAVALCQLIARLGETPAGRPILPPAAFAIPPGWHLLIPCCGGISAWRIGTRSCPSSGATGAL